MTNSYNAFVRVCGASELCDQDRETIDEEEQWKRTCQSVMAFIGERKGRSYMKRTGNFSIREKTRRFIGYTHLSRTALPQNICPMHSCFV